MRVAAVTVNWNQTDLTCACLVSLQRGTLRPEWSIVVDNASSIDPTVRLRAVAVDVEVVRNSANLGFAAAVNSGIERAFALGAQAVLVVNNDAVVHPKCVGELVTALASDETLAGVGAKILTQDNPPRIHTAYGILTYHGWLVQQQGWLEPDVTRYSEPADVDYISGCAMLLRRAALEHVGLLDPEYFAYHEDLDWCTRAHRAGYRVRYIPTALVYHRMHASTGGGCESPIGYLTARNSIMFVRKHAGWRQRLKFACYLGGHLVKEWAFRYRRGELEGFKLRVRGLRDGLLRRPVPLRELGLESQRHGSATGA